ncbi:uncharacterized protein RHO25_010249 [Cercospora beticola]|uniref:Uncharacterized protein n=1 Tax=Cercospora beticola TaxID=122368 RepID=A0ABZ0P1H8_CERBT|nr:hypothetical protein RHO25_010249 [Cercospora beticola]CAK1365428.1 unnamed protein product [Cercospora beticola]
MLLNNFSAVLAVLANGVLAKDRTECYTAMTTKNAPRYLEIKYSTYDQPCTRTSTTTIYTTTTPKVYKTDVRYSTTTVTDKKTNTYTTKVYNTVTTTKDYVSTPTSVSTSVVQVFQDTVVPAPAGFVPVQTSLPGSTFTNNTMRRRSLDTLHKRAYKSQKQYPKKVQCNVYTPSKQCEIKHKIVTKKKQASYPETFIVKTTKVVTATVCPIAKVTATTTKTRTSEAIRVVPTTVSTTITSTNIAGTTTVFGVCLQTANYANLASGRPIESVDELPEGRATLEATTVKENAYQCCNAAMLARGNFGDLVRSPQVFLFRPAQSADDSEPEQDNGGVCEIYGARECGVNQAANEWAAVLDEDDPEDPTDGSALLSTVGNAICGQVVPAPEEEEGGQGGGFKQDPIG